MISDFKNKKLIAPIFTVTFFMTGFYVFYPFLAPYLISKGFVKEQISVIFSAAPFSLIIVSSVLGKLSDEMGRKKIMIFSLLMIIASILMFLYLTNSVVVLVIAIILIAIGLDGYSLTVLQKFEDNIKKERGLMTGIFQSISCLGLLIGPLIGTLIVSFLPIEFTFKIALIILIVLFIVHYTEEDEPHGAKTSKSFNFILNIKEFWQVKGLRGMGILGVATHVTSPAQTVFIPIFIIESLHGNLADVGMFASIFGFFHLLQFFSGRLCDKNGSKVIVLRSVFVYGLVFLSLFFVNSILMLFLLGAVFSLSGSFWNTSAWCYMSKIGESIKKEGMVTGSYVSIAKIGAAWSYLLSGMIVTFFGIKILFLIYGFILIGAVIASTNYLIDHGAEAELEHA